MTSSTATTRTDRDREGGREGGRGRERDQKKQIQTEGGRDTQTSYS